MHWYVNRLLGHTFSQACELTSARKNHSFLRLRLEIAFMDRSRELDIDGELAPIWNFGRAGPGHASLAPTELPAFGI